jgi:hypothetical protein
MDPNRILATARSDIKWADDYYRDHIEQDLIRRYEVYKSSQERYRKMYPKLSEKNDMRTFDLWSTVEWLLPNILKAYFGADRIISMSGVSSEDADRAERVMKLLQWQLTVKNQGYKVFKSWFGDALATNLGVLKCYWKRETETVPHQDMMDQGQLVGLLQNPENKIISSEPLGILPMAMVQWTEERVTVNQPVIETIRPSDIRFTPDGRNLGECSMVAHRKVVTIDELRREAKRGTYDPEAVEAVASGAVDDYELTEVEKILNDGAEDIADHVSTEQARAKVVLYECYLKSDIDEDGMLEDAIVTVCNDKLLRAVENPYKRVPLFDLVPFWDSYKVWSDLGLAEVIEGTQDSHTALLRQMLVSLGLSNQPRVVVDVTKINMDDFEGDLQYIRSTGELSNSFQVVPTAGLNTQNFQFLEYLKGQLEEWTPITRYNQGLDAKSLNKTATGIQMIMGASQQREEEIIRNFAETGIRDLFRFLIQINQRFLDQPQVVRLQNEVLEFSQDDIFGDFDLSVDASAGIAARDGKVQVLASYLKEMFPFALQLGIAGPQQFVMAGQKLLQLMGIEDADKYLPMPQPQQQQLMMGGGMPSGGGQAGPPAQAGFGGGQGADSAGGAGPVF